MSKQEELGHIQELKHLKRDGINIFIDSSRPLWLATNNAGAELISVLRSDDSDRAELIDKLLGKEDSRSQVFLDRIKELGLVNKDKPEAKDYPGRDGLICHSSMGELWIHVTNDCNLTCKHCLVSARRHKNKNKKELAFDEIKNIVRQARSLKTKRFFFTGGEPFLRKDIIKLIKEVISENQLIILTNASLIKDYEEEFKNLDNRKNLLFQVSLEGPNAEIHESIRGPGSFESALSGIKKLKELGYKPIISTVLTNKNIDYLAETNKLLYTLGIETHHIIWLHRRGRAVLHNDMNVSADQMKEAMRELEEVSRITGITVDNYKSMKGQISSRQDTRFDLCHAGYETLAIGPEGQVFPCAALVGEERLVCGNVKDQNLEEIWTSSPVINRVRSATLADEPSCRECDLRFLCGGGCLSYKFYNSGKLSGPDPYCQVYKDMLVDILFNTAEQEKAGNACDKTKDRAPGQTGVAEKGVCKSEQEPVIYIASQPRSGEPDDAGFDVRAFHCACVLTTENGCEPCCG